MEMQPHSEPLRAILQPRLSSTLAGVKKSVRCHHKKVSVKHDDMMIWCSKEDSRGKSPKLRTYPHRIHGPTKVHHVHHVHRWGSTPASSDSQASVEEHQENDHENASVWEPWVEGKIVGPKKIWWDWTLPWAATIKNIAPARLVAPSF